MVEGRSKHVFKRWLAARPKPWRDGIETVAMDGFTGFKTATVEELPDAVAVMDPFHVVRLGGDAVDRCRQRVQQATLGHRGRSGDPLYMVRRTLHTGQELLTENQRARLHAIFTIPEHADVEAVWHVYQRMITAYREPDKTKGKQIMQAVIASLSTVAAGAVAELRRLGRTLKRRAGDILAFFDRPGTSNGPTEAINGAGSNTFAAPLSASATSRTTSRGHCSKPADSDRSYTLVCDEPDRLACVTDPAVPGLRWGVLATGGIAHAFAGDLRVSGRDLVAVGSRSQGSADRFAAEFGIPHAHGSYADLVADPGVDIVYVSTPHPLHAENALLALEAGKHVLVEKPFTLNATEAARVRDVAAASGLLAMEAMWTRYLPHMVRIRELLAGGALGEVRSVLADHTQLLPADPAHRLNALELGGGALLDLGIYPISFAWDVLGAPTSITAKARLGETGADTEVATIFTHATGALSTSISGSRGAGPNMAHIVGTEARIDIDRVWYTPTTFRLVSPGGAVQEEYVSDVEGRGMQFQALAAERLVAEGNLAGDILPIDESVAIMGALDEVRRQIGVRYPGE